MMVLVVLAHTLKKLDNSELKFMMQEMRLNNCNGLTVISSLRLRIFSVGHCRNCCNFVIMSQLYTSEVVTSHVLHCYCSMMYSFVAIYGFVCNNSGDTETQLLQFCFLAFYGGKMLDTLDEYRYYNRNIAIKSMGATFTLAAFPPTSAAAQQISLRTYLQMQQWLGRDLPPAEWGWKYHNNSLIPIATDLLAAPQKLMKVISSTVKQDAQVRFVGADKQECHVLQVRIVWGNWLQQYTTSWPLISCNAV